MVKKIVRYFYEPVKKNKVIRAIFVFVFIMGISAIVSGEKSIGSIPKLENASFFHGKFNPISNGVARFEADGNQIEIGCGAYSERRRKCFLDEKLRRHWGANVDVWYFGSEKGKYILKMSRGGEQLIKYEDVMFGWRFRSGVYNDVRWLFFISFGVFCIFCTLWAFSSENVKS